jgi:hypothetical protein
MLNGLLRKLQSGVVAAAVLAASAIADDGGGTTILRYQKDAARDRGWALTTEGVAVFDYRTRETTGFVHLPGWVWAGEAYICPPDLALGPKGEVLVSSNVIPSLWRIDPVTLRVTRHDLAIDAHQDKDVGFTGLTYSAQLGVYLGVSPFGALWRIDPQLRRAQEVRLSESIQRPCSVTPITRGADGRSLRLFRLCVHGDGIAWTVHLAPDQRSGYVREGCITL